MPYKKKKQQQQMRSLYKDDWQYEILWDVQERCEDVVCTYT